MIKISSVVVATPNLPATPVDDELVVLDINGANYVGFDAIGRRIWERIAAPTRVDLLCNDLSTQFSGTAPQIQQDVIAFLNELAVGGLIDTVSG